MLRANGSQGASILLTAKHSSHSDMSGLRKGAVCGAGTFSHPAGGFRWRPLHQACVILFHSRPACRHVKLLAQHSSRLRQVRGAAGAPGAAIRNCRVRQAAPTARPSFMEHQHYSKTCLHTSSNCSDFLNALLVCSMGTYCFCAWSPCRIGFPPTGVRTSPDHDHVLFEAGLCIHHRNQPDTHRGCWE